MTVTDSTTVRLTREQEEDFLRRHYAQAVREALAQETRKVRASRPFDERHPGCRVLRASSNEMRILRLIGATGIPTAGDAEIILMNLKASVDEALALTQRDLEGKQ